MVGRVPRHAIFQIYNNSCCLDKFVILGLVDISVTFRDVWEPVPYGKVWFPRGDRYIGYVSGRVGTRPLRKCLFSSITTVLSVKFDCQCGHGTTCPYG